MPSDRTTTDAPATLRLTGSPSRRRIGLLAGAGRFPIVFAAAAQRAGIAVYCVGVEGLVPEELRELCDGFDYTPLAKIGRAIRLFKRRKIDTVVMAGKIEKTALFDRWRWVKLMPDWRTLHLAFHYLANKKDDTLLLAVIKEFERDQIRFESALKFCPELLVKHGFLTHRKPSPAQWTDIRFGWEIAKEMGRLDIGQSVIVCDTAVIAVEAIEGTDNCIRRAGELCRRGGFTVVKVAKPQQDLRFDVPTVGLKTLQTMHEAGGRVLAIEAGMTILLDQQEVIDLADTLGIAIVSVKTDEMALRLAG
ncbi:MAG TPA: UDP-2,3-diacylglucosamine diphosphatase LpxI [Planctomycetaceae bacterium]|nr:UDP-2,3-diacylglucosamine diphosphatase LpxI [Planctomycetaceae bacterium]